MHKKTFYLSFLLVACLLLFGSSYLSAQSVTFQSKTVQRCTDAVLNITVDSPTELSALEIVFDVTGDYTSFDVNFAGGFTVLTNRFGPVIDGNVVRMAATKDLAGGDVCLDASGGIVVGEITLHMADSCDGAIEIAGTTITVGLVTASTGLVGCDPIVGLATEVTAGTVTIVNQAPVITDCPGDMTVHWGDFVQFDVVADDPDLVNGCETLSFSVADGPGSINSSGHYTWATGGDDVCDHPVTIEVADKCGATVECSLNICVQNTPPIADTVLILKATGLEPVTIVAGDTVTSVWCVTLSGQIIADDPDGGPYDLLYQEVSFEAAVGGSAPTWYGDGLQLDNGTGEWTWDIGDVSEYLGDFELCIKVSDGAETCDPCSPENADTICFIIHVVGFLVEIEKVEDAFQGHNTSVSIFLDDSLANVFCDSAVCEDLIGGFDFLIAYDAAALTFLNAEKGDIIAGVFEYFSYRTGPFGNCGSGCPSGMVRVIGFRETNDGVLNGDHILGPGELVKLNFYISNDRNLECQLVPIRFFWFDCGDNTISNESGKTLYLGQQVLDYWGEPLDSAYEAAFGFYGAVDTCYELYTNKNAPMGAIVFWNGGIKIPCADEIDDRGDINLNGVANEIADVVVFTNYFIYGMSAFSEYPTHREAQIAATEVNGDGFVLTVADLVYLIRIVVGDALPLPTKENANAFAKFASHGDVVKVETNVDIGAALFVFNGHVSPTLAPDARHMELLYDYDGNTTRALVYSMDIGDAITSGEILNVDRGAALVSVEAAEYRGTRIEKTSTELLPVAYELKQNYPNPFNPVTTIEMALPVASDWTIAIYNVSGQMVAEFSGYSEAGLVSVDWSAENVASGIYFYKAQAATFSATKKMVLLK